MTISSVQVTLWLDNDQHRREAIVGRVVASFPRPYPQNLWRKHLQVVEQLLNGSVRPVSAVESKFAFQRVRRKQLCDTRGRERTIWPIVFHPQEQRSHRNPNRQGPVQAAAWPDQVIRIWGCAAAPPETHWPVAGRSRQLPGPGPNPGRCFSPRTEIPSASNGWDPDCHETRCCNPGWR